MSKLTALAKLEAALMPILNDMGYDLVRLHYTGGLGRHGDPEASDGRSPSRGSRASRPQGGRKQGGHTQATLQIMAERHDRANMTVRDCSAISRAVSDWLEQDDPIDAAYLLEVSSPGLDRPLVKAKDYERFTGEVARIEMAMMIEGRKKFTGSLAGLNSDESGQFVLLDEAGKIFRLPLALIDKSRLVITDAVMARELAKQIDQDGDIDIEDADRGIHHHA
ncbi:MAG: ribosome maturation factor RimP [Candidatus Symbiobacter sp.]|nr:ribosome maturation factor RimP [Candidatus Symbiobacter sp.]